MGEIIEIPREKKGLTICKKCIYFSSRADGPRTGVWYNLFCTAIERPPGIDVVTGEKGYQASNSLGDGYITEDRYYNCRDINNGNCPHYKAKEGA